MAQLVANLSGISESPVKFDGKFMNAEELMTDLKSEGFISKYVNYLRMLCQMYMGDWENASEGSSSLTRKWGNSSHYSCLFTNVYAGINSLKAYGRTGNPTHRKKGIECIKFLKRWVLRGAINLPPCLWFMQAQLAAANKDEYLSVKVLFSKAITGLHRCGFRHLEALACENMAAFSMEKGEEDESTFYIQRAFALYVEWGALAKASQMKRLHPDDLRGFDLKNSKANIRREYEREDRFRRSTWFCEINSIASSLDD